MPTRRVQFLEGLEAFPSTAGPVRFIHYTDPYSVWCWGAQPVLRAIEYLYEGRIAVEHRIGGMFEDFTPVLKQWQKESGDKWKDGVLKFLEGVCDRCGMPFDRERVSSRLGKFRSTWPACIAAKAAFLQGEAEGSRYLRRMREAIELEGVDVDPPHAQVALAEEVGLDTARFDRALTSGEARRAFDEDRAECAQQSVSGFPTFAFQRGQVRVEIDGYQPWDHFADALSKLAPDLAPKTGNATASEAADILSRFGRGATREVAVCLRSNDDETELLLDELAATGKAVRKPGGKGVMWERPGFGWGPGKDK